jgi:hypothetical protein
MLGLASRSHSYTSEREKGGEGCAALRDGFVVERELSAPVAENRDVQILPSRSCRL